jgi:hypothetical protein
VVAQFVRRRVASFHQIEVIARDGVDSVTITVPTISAAMAAEELLGDVADVTDEQWRRGWYQMGDRLALNVHVRTMRENPSQAGTAA